MEKGETDLCFIDAATTRACEADGAEPIRRPYRPIPRDFVERWPQFGWGGAEMEWHAHARTIARWVDEAGREKMIMARKAYLDAQRAVTARARRKRYHMGRTLTPANPQSAARTEWMAELLASDGGSAEQD